MKNSLKEKLKKFFIYFLGAFFISIFLISTYIYFPQTFKVFDNKITDLMFSFRGEIKGGKQIVIVDIDEKSLDALGQWPWSRDIMANLIEKCSINGAGIIGLDIVFAEFDRTSPSVLAEKLNLPQNLKLDNYDALFAQTISKTPVILGYQFEMVEKPFLKKEPPIIPAIFIEKNKEDDFDLVLNAKGVILNNPLIQKAGYSSGFFNNIPDESGITRSVPLIIRYENQLYPSLVLEMIRAANNIQKVTVNYNHLGVESIGLGDFFIPTDKNGRLLINFRGKEKSFKYISAIDILEDKIAPNELAGKILFIGTSAAGLFDLRATPFETVFPGVEIHANAMDNILNGEYITSPYWVEGANILSVILIAFFVALIVYFSPLAFIPFAFVVLFLGIGFLNYYILFTHHISLNTFLSFVALMLSFSFSMLINYFYESKQKELIKQKFSSKVSKSVMEDILKSGENDILSAKDRVVTVFFSDIRGFTSISEEMANPRALIEYLNRYLNPVTDIIIKNGGTIDKYIGDAVMAYWNAPADLLNHQDKAIKASLEQFVFLKQINPILEEEKLPKIDIGIGINTGNVTVGEMGSIERSDYTIIGDAVNLGSRLESLCKTYGAKLIISEFTKNGLKEEYILRNLDLVRVKGKSEAIEIFELIDYKTNPILIDDLQKTLTEINLFNSAISHYRKSEFQIALDIFKEIEVTFNPINTTIYQIYIKRCEYFIENPPIDFDGIFTHRLK